MLTESEVFVEHVMGLLTDHCRTNDKDQRNGKLKDNELLAKIVFPVGADGALAFQTDCGPKGGHHTGRVKPRKQGRGDDEGGEEEQE